MNKFKMCVIDTETTGLSFLENDILEISALPLMDDFEIDGSVEPFQVLINDPSIDLKSKSARKARRVNKISIEEIEEKGVTKIEAAAMFRGWISSFKGKKIQPIAQNWPFDKAMLQVLMGQDIMDNVIHYHFKDTQAVAEFINDYHYFMYGEVFFPRTSLYELSKKLEIDHKPTHRALDDCIATAKVYKSLIHLTQKITRESYGNSFYGKCDEKETN
jgi:DNA polymerase III epsilon subunit-like protein